MGFALTVLNVNDQPVITSVLPENGTSYKEGDEITFKATATDEDGDTLYYTWKEGGKVLGKGSELPYDKLSPGTHNITLVVDDEVALTSQQLTVEIKEKEDGPGFAFLSGLLAIGTFILMISIRRKFKRSLI